MFGDTNWQSQIPSTVVDSKSLMPILLNQATTVRPWAFTEVFKIPTVSGDGKTLRNADYKLLKFDNGTEKFYNLNLNPIETNANNLLLGTMSATDITNYNYLCSEMATLVGTGITCTSLNTNSFSKNTAEIYLTENPFHSKINLINTTGNEVYELYSIKGEKLYEGKNIASKDFSYLSKGIYVLKVINEKTAFIKIIKE